MNKLKIYFIFGLILFLNIGHSQSYSVSILTEDDRKENIDCDYRQQQVRSSVASALRYNRITVVEKNADMVNYVNVNAFSISNSSCIFNIGISFYSYLYNQFPNSKKKVFTKSLYCYKGYLGLAQKFNMASMIDSQIKLLTDECINEIETEFKNTR